MFSTLKTTAVLLIPSFPSCATTEPRLPIGKKVWRGRTIILSRCVMGTVKPCCWDPSALSVSLEGRSAYSPSVELPQLALPRLDSGPKPSNPSGPVTRSRQVTRSALADDRLGHLADHLLDELNGVSGVQSRVDHASKPRLVFPHIFDFGSSDVFCMAL